MAELNPNAKLWVEALRSGKFQQGQRALTEVKDGAEFDCCLGVACKVAMANGLQMETHVAVRNCGTDTVPEQKQLRYYDNFSYGTLPNPVVKWLGLQTGDGSYKGEDEWRQLTGDNDNGQTFEQIAATVESTPQGLFIEAQ